MFAPQTQRQPSISVVLQSGEREDGTGTGRSWGALEAQAKSPEHSVGVHLALELDPPPNKYWGRVSMGFPWFPFFLFLVFR